PSYTKGGGRCIGPVAASGLAGGGMRGKAGGEEDDVMLKAYISNNGGLAPLPDGVALSEALWIDLYRPQPEQVVAVAALGVDVPTLEDMEEIEISNRLYREGGLDYMTVVVPGHTPEGGQIAAPVCLILGPARMVTVRHHAPRPFETFPGRADKSGNGCDAPQEVFLGLVGEVIGRQADLLELSGKALDTVSAAVFTVPSGRTKPQAMGQVLARIGAEGEAIGRVRLACLTLERALSFYAQARDGGEGAVRLKGTVGQSVKSLTKDIQSLEVHADHLSNRVALASDAALGMINLEQNATVRIVSVVAVLFLPPTLIASIYGMNFEVMPELSQSWGYAAALGAMLASAVLTFAFFRWKNWL
ncbi:MAG: magnesium transporter CorA family protein, partial [Paracoccaceae bacterium]